MSCAKLHSNFCSTVSCFDELFPRLSNPAEMTVGGYTGKGKGIYHLIRVCRGSI